MYICGWPLQDRGKLPVNGVNAAKAAGVPHILVLSVSTADDVSTVFGRQFHEVEEVVKSSGLAYTLFRLPLFTDNNW
jgi:uncharacterized protein YbjT (DUF2867 family)